MKKYLCGGLFAVILGSAAIFAVADDKKPETQTIKGEVVDLACYLSEGKSGPEHVKCAKSCVAGGSPAGLLTPDGNVILIVVHGKEGKSPLEHVGERVEVKGKVYEKGGMKGIIAESCTPMKEGEGSDHK